MLYSHSQTEKQKPWEESVRVPFLVRYPAVHGKTGGKIDMPINAPDIMPTLLGLSGIAIPKSVEGKDFSGVIKGTKLPAERHPFREDNDAALIMCPVPFHQWNYPRGGREYRGVRTRRYTYVRDINGPWLTSFLVCGCATRYGCAQPLDETSGATVRRFCQTDPYQLENLCNNPPQSRRGRLSADALR